MKLTPQRQQYAYFEYLKRREKIFEKNEEKINKNQNKTQFHIEDECNE